MHEMSLMNDLLHKIENIARQENAREVIGVSVRLGALSHISPEHFREHFESGTRGSIAECAHLEIETSDDMNDPHAQDILLTSIHVN